MRVLTVSMGWVKFTAITAAVPPKPKNISEKHRRMRGALQGERNENYRLVENTSHLVVVVCRKGDLNYSIAPTHGL